MDGPDGRHPCDGALFACAAEEPIDNRNPEWRLAEVSAGSGSRSIPTDIGPCDHRPLCRGEGRGGTCRPHNARIVS